MEKVGQRGGFEARRFMREQGLGNPIRALWYITQVMLDQHASPAKPALELWFRPKHVGRDQWLAVAEEVTSIG